MSGLFSKYATDQNLENEGAPFVEQVLPDGRERIFYLARMDDSNRAYAKAMRTMRKKHESQIRMGSMDEALDRRLTMQVFVETILKGWDNVEIDAPIPGKQGKLPYTRENALWLMQTLPDLYKTLLAAAQESALFKDAQFMGEANGSANTSDGSSTTERMPEASQSS